MPMLYMRSIIKYSASLAAASLLTALLGGCAGHANEQQPTATTATTAPVDDAALTSNVQTTLANTPGVNANEINVQSSGGVVTLSGDVDSTSAASAAVQATQNVNGVTSVHNDLTVVNPPRRAKSPKGLGSDAAAGMIQRRFAYWRGVIHHLS